ncbi:MAG: lysophospholipid acyltransferase family protein, partial [Paludibacteraceae bacterium]|nr:lysophospholipid acyltransferase family protein [Paludibacteraceae bacterium]
RIQYIIVYVLFFPLIYHVVRYRRKVVRQNLTESFPAMSAKEIKQTERRFYRHLCDLAVETIHFSYMPTKEAQRRIRFENTQIVDQCIRKHGNIIVYLSHYGNWEWMSAYPAVVQPDYQAMSVYRRFKSESNTAAMMQLRERFGFKYAEKHDTLRVIIKQMRAGVHCMWGMIADQHPSSANEHYWTPFLNHDTAILTGTEVIARRMNWPVAYMEMHRTGRGKYMGRFVLITEEPLKQAEFSITEQYARLLEQNILEQPAYWLWTHKRWKHRRSEAQPQHT